MGIDDNLLPDQVEAVNNGDMELYFFVVAILRVKGLDVEMRMVDLVSYGDEPLEAVKVATFSEVAKVGFLEVNETRGVEISGNVIVVLFSFFDVKIAIDERLELIEENLGVFVIALVSGLVLENGGNVDDDCINKLVVDPSKDDILIFPDECDGGDFPEVFSRVELVVDDSKRFVDL